MAKVYRRNSDNALTVNANVAHGAEAIFNLKECLKKAGWRMRAWGTGTGGTVNTVHFAADPFTTGSAPETPGSLANPLAWFVMQGPAGKSGVGDTIVAGSPVLLNDAGASFSSTDVGKFIVITDASNPANNGSFQITAVNSATQIAFTNGSAVNETSSFNWSIARREWLFQRSSSAGNYYSWRVYYSALDHFTGTGFGTPISATVPPSAADQQQIIGTTGAYATMFPTTGAHTHHCIAFDAPEGDVYSFLSWVTQGGPDVTYAFFMDALMSGSYPPNTANDVAPNGDSDPVIVYFSSGGFPVAELYGSGNARSWYKMNMAGETWVIQSAAQVYRLGAGSTMIFPYNGTSGQGCGSDPYDNLEDSLHILFGRPTGGFGTQTGHKGQTKHLRWRGVAKYWPSSVNLATDGWVYVDDCMVPWPENIMPVWG